MTLDLTSVIDGPGGEPMPTPLSPAEFALACRAIVETHAKHPAHRELDLLTNRVLSSLGYGEGIAIFEAAVADWHKPTKPYPSKPRIPWACRLGMHRWVWRDTSGDTCMTFDTAHCSRCPKTTFSNPCP